MISEAANVKAKQKLGVVNETKVSKDSNVRSVTVCYALVSDKDNVKSCLGSALSAEIVAHPYSRRTAGQCRCKGA